MSGFGDRFAAWCREQNKVVPDAELIEVLNEVGQKVVENIRLELPALLEQAAGLDQFMQSVGMRRDAPAVETVQYSAVEITRSALESLLDEATAYGANETGGRLAGYAEPSRQVLRVTHATPGGPHARREPHMFVSDPEYCQVLLNAIVNQTGGKSDYVGEWHRHVGRQTHASPMDAATLQAIATSPQYGTPQPLLIICGLPDAARRDQRQITAFACLRGAIYEVPMQVLPGE